jgi:hypothetical protein
VYLVRDFLQLSSSPTDNMDLWIIPLFVSMIAMNIIQTTGFCDSSIDYGGCACYMDGVDIFLTCTTFPVDLNGLLEDEAVFTTSIGVVGEELPDLLTYDVSKWTKLTEIYDNNRKFKCTGGMCILSDHTFSTKLQPTQQLDLIKSTPNKSNQPNESADTVNTMSTNPQPSWNYTTKVNPPLIMTTTQSKKVTTTTNPYPSSMTSIKIIRGIPLSTPSTSRTSRTNIKTISSIPPTSIFKVKDNNTTTPPQSTLITDGFNESMLSQTRQPYKIPFYIILLLLICMVFSNIILFRKFMKKRYHYAFPQESIELNDFV